MDGRFSRVKIVSRIADLLDKKSEGPPADRSPFNAIRIV